MSWNRTGSGLTWSGVLVLAAVAVIPPACGPDDVSLSAAALPEIRGERIDAPVAAPAASAAPVAAAGPETVDAADAAVAEPFEIPYEADEPLAAGDLDALPAVDTDVEEPVIIEELVEVEDPVVTQVVARDETPVANADDSAAPSSRAEESTRADDGEPVFVSFDDLSVPDYDPVTLWNKPAEPRPPYEFPDDIAALDGKRVTIDGFVIPTKAWGGELREFALSMDPPGCCFGQSTAIDKWIEVELVPDIPPVEYSAYGIVTVTGTLTVSERYSDYGYVESLYQLVADHAELSW